MKKKVLIFIEDGSYSFDNRVKREADTLVNNGWQVTVISPKYKDDPFIKKVNSNLNLLFFPKYNGDNLIGHAIEHLQTLLFGFFYVFFAYIIYGFKIIHACNPMDIIWIIALPYKFLGVKFIFDQHDLCPEIYLSRTNGKEDIIYKILLFLEKASYYFADTVIATNNSYKEISINRGKKCKNKVFVVRNGPTISKFTNFKQYLPIRKGNEIIIGYIGNMNKQDGVEYILYAASEMVKGCNIKNIKFYLIGGGAFQSALKLKTIEMGLEDFVIFTGRIPDNEMLNILSQSDICIQPDPYNPLNDLSTMNKVMEYMALKKPVVAFRLKETVFSGGDAVLYAEPNIITDMAQKIVQLINDPNLRQELGEKGFKRVSESLCWSHSEENLLKAYSSLSK